jgi:hypothetical protein
MSEHHTAHQKRFKHFPPVIIAGFRNCGDRATSSRKGDKGSPDVKVCRATVVKRGIQGTSNRPLRAKMQENSMISAPNHLLGQANLW